MNKNLAIIIPHYEDVATETFLKNLSKEINEESIVIVVDDGSLKYKADIDWLNQANLNGHIVYLKQNMGHQAAISTGLNYAVNELDASRYIIMDADGEDKPSSIHQLLDELNMEEAHCVVAQRRSRVESIQFKLFYSIYRLIFGMFVGKSISFGNFIAMNRQAASRLIDIKSIWQHVAATVLISKVDFSLAPIDRGKRYSGKSKMNLTSLTLHGLKAIMVFSEQVLVRISLFCALLAALLITGLITMLILKATGLAIAGWFSTISGILILMLLQIGITTLMILFIAGNLNNLGESKIDYKSHINQIIKTS